MHIMTRLRHARTCLGWVFMLSFFALSAQAQAAVDPKEESRHRLVEEVTQQMFSIVEEYQGGTENPEAYHREITELLEPVATATAGVLAEVESWA